jgi:NADH:ubiquinone reductase (H+-translocating)
VVIVGAGFGGLAAAQRLEREAVDVLLVDQRNYHTFQPLLYQVATAGLNAADVAYAVRGIFQRAHRVAFRNARVTSIDLDERRVHLDGEEPVPYDHLIVAAGSAANFFGTPGCEEHCLPLYSLDEAVRLRNHVLRQFELADADPSLVERGALTFVVVGGGPTGVEVAGALAELISHVLRKDFHTLDVARARVVLVEQSDRLLAAFSPRSRRYARRTLESRGVEVWLDAAVAEVRADSVHLANGDVLHTATLVWAAGVRAGPLADALGAGGVRQGRGGRLVVGADLSLPGHPNAYAIGDVADIDDGRGGRLPQLAQVAMQSGGHAAEQILATIAREPRSAFTYRDKGTMATIGRRAAVAELAGGRELTGAVAWLAWLALHLLYLLGMRNRVSVFVNWAWNYLTWDRGPRLIFGAGDERSAGP